MNKIVVQYLMEHKDKIVNLLDSLYGSGVLDERNNYGDNGSVESGSTFDLIVGLFKGDVVEDSAMRCGTVEYVRPSSGIPVVRCGDDDKDILRAILRSTYLHGYVDGARGADANDYEAAECAVDNLFAIVEKRNGKGSI